MPKIPDINADISITRENAVNIIIASIAMEELALAHILNAEGEKLQYVLGTLEGGQKPDEVTICDVMAVNKSIQKTLRDVIKTEMLLQFKLEDAIELSESEDKCGMMTIKGQKIWRDGNNIAGKRPASVEIRLLRDGVIYGTPVTVSSTGNGKFSFSCLPVFDNFGHEYIYTVDESVVPAGYTKRIDGYNIINTIEAGTRTINGTKTWVDSGVGTRPQGVEIFLLQNGEDFDSKTIANNVPNFSFDVPQFDGEGTPFVYTVEEDEVDNYTTTINGYNITNTIKNP